MNWNELVGRSVVALRGHKYKRDGRVRSAYILFDDKETVLSLDEQDPYTYHDCNHSARELSLVKDAK